MEASWVVIVSYNNNHGGRNKGEKNRTSALAANFTGVVTPCHYVVESITMLHGTHLEW